MGLDLSWMLKSSEVVTYVSYVCSRHWLKHHFLVKKIKNIYVWRSDEFLALKLKSTYLYHTNLHNAPGVSHMDETKDRGGFSKENKQME